MDKRTLLIELFEDFLSSRNDHTRGNFLERCINAQYFELKEFTNELSQLLRKSPDYYLSLIHAFVSCLYNEFPVATGRHKNYLPNFASILVNDVLLSNLKHSYIRSFGLSLYYCIELLWRARDQFDSNQTLKHVFHEVSKENNAFQILISAPSCKYFKRILFDFNLINKIEKDELLKATDNIAALIGDCNEYKDIPTRSSEGLSIYISCTALLKILRDYRNLESTTKKEVLPPSLQNMVRLESKERRYSKESRISEKQKAEMNRLRKSLSVQDEQHLSVLGMKFPQKLAQIPNFLRELEQRKITTFQVCMTIFFSLQIYT